MNADERERHVRKLFPVVFKIAHRVARVCRVPDEDDLVGDGALGLVRALDTYDPRRGVTLDRYARHVILGAMLNGLRRKDPVSERARRRVREGDRLQAAREIPLSERELEEALPGITRARAQVERGLPLSLDAPLPTGARIRADWANDPAQVYEGIARERVVRSALERLSPRQREIVEQHYFADTSLRTISETLAVTPQRVSQLHCAALHARRRHRRSPMSDITSATNTSISGAKPLALADLASEKQEQLPRDHPRQPGDTIALSTQAFRGQENPAGMPPASPAGFWDHSTRTAPVGDRQIGVDASGSYKLD
jgi:RNA polymerase sigma factor for flagellar operon FliA